MRSQSAEITAANEMPGANWSGVNCTRRRFPQQRHRTLFNRFPAAKVMESASAC